MAGTCCGLAGGGPRRDTRQTRGHHAGAGYAHAPVPGSPVDFAVLKAAEQRLIESDLFSSVRVFIELPIEEEVRRMYLDDKTYPVEVVWRPSAS